VRPSFLSFARVSATSRKKITQNLDLVEVLRQRVWEQVKSLLGGDGSPLIPLGHVVNHVIGSLILNQHTSIQQITSTIVDGRQKHPEVKYRRQVTQRRRWFPVV
jgi:hypothetical protein